MPKKSQRFRIEPDHNDADSPRKLFADNLRGERVQVKAGTEFNAVMEQDSTREKVFKDSRIIPAELLNSWSVVSSDIDVHPGCLTSLIRTQQAIPIAAAKEIPE